jgi:hypothetical protein
MFTFDRLVPPSLVMTVHLLFLLADRRGGDAGAPQDFRDVLHPPDPFPCQVHLNKGLLYAGFAALVPFDDLRLKRQCPQVRYLQGDHSGFGLQLAGVAARPGIHRPGFRSYRLAPQSWSASLARYWFKTSSTNFLTSPSR